MSTDSDVTSDLIQTLEDGREGFAKGAEKLTATDRAELATILGDYSRQRADFVAELQDLARSYGDQLKESGTVAGAVHRGWMSIKDALSGSDPDGVLDAAEQGEDHAVKVFDDALKKDVSPTLRAVIARQQQAVQAAHDHVRGLRDAA